MGRTKLIIAPPVARSRNAFPWRIVFFTVNMTACAIVMTLFIISLLRAADDLASVILFVAIFGLPSVVVAMAEYSLLRKRTAWLERPLGILAGLVAMVALLLCISNAIEALTNGTKLSISFWTVFIPACLAIAAYGGWCCWLRAMKLTLPDEPGFQVRAFSTTSTPPPASGQYVTKVDRRAP